MVSSQENLVSVFIVEGLQSLRMALSQSSASKGFTDPPKVGGFV
jgi:hypothetical protein